MTATDAADAAACAAVARLGLIFPAPWVISYTRMATVVIFTARRPGLALSQGSAEALEDELWLWERAPQG